MIESLSISNVANYGNIPEVLNDLSQFNFIFGSNGSGKTTISRVIADDAQFPDCKIIWVKGTKLQPMVYNQDFIERNFIQSAEIKGVFTLGKQQADTLAKITSTKDEIDVLTKKIEGLTLSLQGDNDKIGKNAESEALETNFKELCWKQKRKYDADFQDAFEGLRNSSDKFRDRVLSEDATNKIDIYTLVPTETPENVSVTNIVTQELKKKASSVYGPVQAMEDVIPNIDIDCLIAHESNTILTKRVIGKEDVDIGAMIKKLGNSDWVNQGRSYYNINDKICPFCQQSTGESFAKNLNDYFDESFLVANKEIDALVTNYSTDAQRLQQNIEVIIAVPSRFLDVETLKNEKKILDAKIIINNQRLVEKKKEASQIITLESLKNVSDTINSIIEAANSKINEHNAMIKNRDSERKVLTAQVWKLVLEELKTDLLGYKKQKDALKKAIDGINIQITQCTEDIKKKNSELRNLEKQTTSVQPTIDGINALLNNFGFTNFTLAKTATGTSYKLIRSDGTDAKKTLSEGEKNFVCFLYFYHLLKGSDSESGIVNNRIVVFDDPVSSLDSDILFIVSSLIKGVLDDVRNKNGYIKQIFILTHNVYFHREITFNPNRKNGAMNEESFWVIRKINNNPQIINHKDNPIKTSYELLWAEIRNSNRSNLTIQNTIRRILENYFKILGGINPDEICEKFDGKDKLICKSLFSWVNAGSHFTDDDLYIAIDDTQVDNQLRVFREIFTKSSQIAHYKMMMGDAYQEPISEENNINSDISEVTS